ncbi:hypothetical protein RA280_31345 [Cupriavidus sp. CV2]|uniref:hypothetical protein n=1 Tax=Cupriavidus ulmosensis TaxID=3065913 RepID=UPI00296B05C1|nr:hypothetical protein [Cupriavidus sp. CV2]MDW3686158.1 hypothetical protein [Cupriavidus sp. CV2]
MRSTIAAISAALTFATPPAFALGVLAYGDEPVGDPGAVVQDLISAEFERFFSAAGTVLVIHYDTVQLGMDHVCHATVGISVAPEAGATARLPAWRFNATRLIRDHGSLDLAGKRECLTSAIREAARNMMQMPIPELATRSEASIFGARNTKRAGRDI